MEYPWSTKWNADGWGRFDGVQGQQLKIEGERRFSKNLVKMLSVATALTVMIMQFHTLSVFAVSLVVVDQAGAAQYCTSVIIKAAEQNWIILP